MICFSGRWLRPLFGLTVTGFLLWLLLAQVDLAKVGAAFFQISPLLILTALGFLAAGYTVRVIRWWWMLRAMEPRIPLHACCWPFLVSITVNNLLPLRAGDAVRVVGFRQQLRSPPMRLLGTLVIERLLDLMILLGVFLIGLLGVANGVMPKSIIQLAIWIPGLGVIAVLAILLFSPKVERLISRFTGHPLLAQYAWSKAINRHANYFFNALGILRSPGLTLRLIGLSVIVWGFEGAVFVTIAHALDIQSTLTSPWFALAAGTLATLLPSAPGHVGTFDYFTMMGLVAYGTDLGAAAIFAVLVHMVLWLPLTAAGLIYFLRPGTQMLRRQLVTVLSSSNKSL